MKQRDRIRALLNENGKMLAMEIAEKMNITTKHASALLQSMFKDGAVKKEYSKRSFARNGAKCCLYFLDKKLKLQINEKTKEKNNLAVLADLDKYVMNAYWATR